MAIGELGKGVVKLGNFTGIITTASFWNFGISTVVLFQK